MKRVFIDSSSAILLYQAKLFNPILSLYQIGMARSVYAELTLEGYKGAEYFESLRKRNIVRLSHSPAVDSGTLYTDSLHIGEKETIQSFKSESGDFIIIDDGKAAKWLFNQNVPFINALLCPRILFLSGHLTECEHKSATKIITQKGRYADWVIDWAQKAAEDDLATFFP